MFERETERLFEGYVRASDEQIRMINEKIRWNGSVFTQRFSTDCYYTGLEFDGYYVSPCGTVAVTVDMTDNSKYYEVEEISLL